MTQEDEDRDRDDLAAELGAAYAASIEAAMFSMALTMATILGPDHPTAVDELRAHAEDMHRVLGEFRQWVGAA